MLAVGRFVGGSWPGVRAGNLGAGVVGGRVVEGADGAADRDATPEGGDEGEREREEPGGRTTAS